MKHLYETTVKEVLVGCFFEPYLKFLSRTCEGGVEAIGRGDEVSASDVTFAKYVYEASCGGGPAGNISSRSFPIKQYVVGFPNEAFMKEASARSIHCGSSFMKHI